MTSSHSKGLVYDAISLFGFNTASIPGEVVLRGPGWPFQDLHLTPPLPEARPGEIVIRVGAWSLKDLRTNQIIVQKKLMWDQDWYDEYPWSDTKLTPGNYKLRMLVPYSNRKTFLKAKELLLPGEEVAPVCLAATALLVHLKETGNDLLEGEFARCAESFPCGSHAGLDVDEGHVCVDTCLDCIWLAAARKS